MNRRHFQSRRVLPPLEMELPQQPSFRPVHRPLQTHAPVMNLQNNRIRRPFIRRPPPPPPEAAPQNIPHAPCRFCYNLVPRDSYTEHLTYCPAKLEAQQRDTIGNQQMEIEPPQRNQEEPALQINIEQEGLDRVNQAEPQQLVNPQEVVHEEGSNLENQPMMPDTQDIPAQNPFPVFSGVTTTVFNSVQDNHLEAQSTSPSLIQHTELPLLSNGIQQQEIQQVQNQPAQPGNLPPGSFVLRTVEPGPDGGPSMRTRVISLDNILGGQAGEGGENQRPRILGLLSMLAGLQGARAAQLAAFLGLFGEERGLGRDVLDSLPVVTYTEEGFKNVDEESKKCSICLDDYEEPQEVKFLWCMHRFHKNCVDQWLERHTNCPFCKKDYAEALRFGEYNA